MKTFHSRYETDGSIMAPGKPFDQTRPGYCRTHQHITSGLELRATLRNGEFAWPGGYQLFLLTSDGESLCFDCCEKEIRSVLYSIRNRISDGWRVVGCDINYEDNEMFCSHCSKQIPAAYES